MSLIVKNSQQHFKNNQDYLGSVNGKVEGNKLIKLPKAHHDLCTDNVIVMEYIHHKTINNLELNDENNSKIRDALNSYISSSLYAMFNDLKIVFHGDPHSGNIYFLCIIFCNLDQVCTNTIISMLRCYR